MSKESDLFVDNLKASVQWMAVETVSLYKEKLKRWTLTRAQWSAALDRIIEANTEGRTPPLPAIFEELERQQQSARLAMVMGWASFRWKDRDYSIRIRCVDSVWVISDLTYTDQHGVLRHAQGHVGEPVVEHIPPDSTEFMITPDNPPYPDARDTYSPAEVTALVSKTRLRLVGRSA